MSANQERSVRTTARAGWGILIGVSLLLLLHGVFWGMRGPEVALESIAERTSLTNSGFQVGSPSASDVIALTNRNFAIVEAALGLMALVLAWAGFRSNGCSGSWFGSHGDQLRSGGRVGGRQPWLYRFRTAGFGWLAACPLKPARQF